MIDDLDRCSAERVVKLLETVHTLLREPAATRVLPGWRRPAPLIVLVLADGRWVRAAFEARYESFGTLGSPVHGLGADFLQKVFDHIVLVPALAADQVQTYVDHVTGTSPWAIAGRAGADQNRMPYPPSPFFSRTGPSLIPTVMPSPPGNHRRHPSRPQPYLAPRHRRPTRTQVCPTPPQPTPPQRGPMRPQRNPIRLRSGLIRPRAAQPVGGPSA